MRIRERVQLICEDVSLTKQAFKEDCDINHIFKKWKKDGILTHVNKYQGRYDDVSGIQSYQDSLNQIMAAEEAFMSLPASIRSKFKNDPGEFLDFAMDEKNFDEMVKMGLAKAKPDGAVATPREEAPAPQPEA
jgi:phage internal scaffolding protein